jgi:hypothetical protein
LNILNPRRLLVRQHFRKQRVNAEVVADGVRDGTSVPGQFNGVDMVGATGLEPVTSCV